MSKFLWTKFLWKPFIQIINNLRQSEKKHSN
jgi:hypothetical protein